ncbi:MAG: hypothetical protein BGO09_02945 [Bacteroidetes bacterium 47-18]|nr:MAG: hypothetical protein BGO09_02945 [Bacteroidetes bacterium 47-18]
MLLFSPEYLDVKTAKEMPCILAGYEVKNSSPLYGESPEGKYLFQDIYTGTLHGCFINVLPQHAHRFFISKENAGYFLLIQLHNNLSCHFQGIDNINFYEWGINLFAAKKLHVEINVCNEFSTFVLFIPDKLFNRCAGHYPFLRKIKRTHENTLHTVKLLPNNAICNFALIDLINDLRENEVIKPEILNDVFKQAMQIICKDKGQKKINVPNDIAEKLQSLKQYMTANLSLNFQRNDLMNDFKISLYHFENSFQKIYNLTPFTLLKCYRMQGVKRGIKNNEPLKEIAPRYNYSYNTVSKAFYSVYKKPPLYRKKK